ncbi:MAG: hypothetical protein JXK93_05365 [Sphaerochaetaceae bacterium]|nr:hypothetical protein [Sphaerochaetaceae bacterium]
MRKLSVCMVPALVCAVLMLSLSGCAVESESTGDLVINIKDEVTVTERNIFSTTDGLDMDISAYQIVISEITDQSNPITDMTIAKTSDSIVIEALSPGSYVLGIYGLNESDEIIAYLDEQTSGDPESRYRSFDIEKGEVTTITSAEAVLVPVVDSGVMNSGKVGSLSVTVDWSALEVEGSGFEDFAASLGTPDVEVTVTQMNGAKKHYEINTWVVEDVDVTDQTKTNEDVSVSSSTLVFDSLPVGYYQVTAAVKSGSSAENPGLTMLERMDFVRIVAEYSTGFRSTYTGALTTGTFTITDSTSFLTGSLDLSISEEMDLLALSFTTPPSTVYVNTATSFTVSAPEPASGNSLSYEWYLNGDKITITDPAGTEDITIEETGQYTLTVVVYEKDSSGNGVNFGYASTEITVEEGGFN